MIENTKYSLGLWNVLSDFQSIRASSEFIDFVILDLEHGYRDFNQVISCVLEAHNQNLELMVRLRSFDDPMVQALIDIGISHFVVPQIRNIDEIRILRSKLDPSPQGKRGIHPRHTHGKSIQTSNKNGPRAKLCVIIETISILDSIHEVLSHPGVDEIYLGTFDLSGEMQLSLGPDSLELITILEPVVQEAKLQDKRVIAMVGNKDLLSGWLKMGIQSFILGVDSDLLRLGLASSKSGLESISRM